MNFRMSKKEEEHNNKGNNILPNPPINIGIIIKNIINNPWKVIFELYWSDEHIKNPGKDNSKRIIKLKQYPNDPPIKPDIIYIHPIYKWFVVNKKEGNNNYFSLFFQP